MNARQEFTARIKAFSSDRKAKEQRVLVDEYNAVYVYDDVAGHYTVNHSLSVAQQNRLRARAEEMRG